MPCEIPTERNIATASLDLGTKLQASRHRFPASVKSRVSKFVPSPGKVAAHGYFASLRIESFPGSSNKLSACFPGTTYFDEENHNSRSDLDLSRDRLPMALGLPEGAEERESTSGNQTPADPARRQEAADRFAYLGRPLPS